MDALTIDVIMRTNRSMYSFNSQIDKGSNSHDCLPMTDGLQLQFSLIYQGVILLSISINKVFQYKIMKCRFSSIHKYIDSNSGHKPISTLMILKLLIYCGDIFSNVL